MRLAIFAFVTVVSLIAPRGGEGSFYGKAAASRADPEQRRHDGTSLAHHEEGAFGDVGASGAVVRPSPECWKSAMTAFYLNTTPLSDDDAKVFCQHMHADHQKVLALMISQCHLNDLGKALMEDPVVLQDCLQRAATSREVLLACLKRLTDAGVTAYTHYVAYVQQFCTRLTQELAVQLQVDAHRVMAQRYEQLSNESLQQLEAIHTWQATFLDTFSRSFERDLQQQLHVHLQETLQQQFDQVMQRQAVQQAKMVDDLMTQLKDRQDEQEERQEVWLSQKVDLVQLYLEQLERQHEKLQGQQERIDTLSETIRSVVNDVLPLAGFHRFVGVVTCGYAWVSLTLQTVVGLCLVWFLTRPKRCQTSRSHLVAILVLEAAAEAALFASAQHGWLSGNLRLAYVTQLRKCTFALECFAYCLGFVVSFYRAPAGGDDPSRILSMLKLELEQLRLQQNQLVTNLNPEINKWVAANPIATAPRPGPLSPVPVRVTQATAHQIAEAYPQTDWSQHVSTIPRHLKPRLAPHFGAYNPRTSVERNGATFDPHSTPESGYNRGYDAYSSFASLPTAYLQTRPPMPIPVSHAPDHRHWLPVYPPSPAPHSSSSHHPSSNLARPPPYSPPGSADVVSPSKYDATAAHPPPVPGELNATEAGLEHRSPLESRELGKKRLRDDCQEGESDRVEKKPRIPGDLHLRAEA
jgi:hypothetical protein